jgi:hypothetical protein
VRALICLVDTSPETSTDQLLLTITMAPYNNTNTSSAYTFLPKVYEKPGIIDFIHGLPRYGFGNNVVDFFSGGQDKSGYVKG